MTHEELFVEPEYIFESMSHILENTVAYQDNWGNIAKEYQLTQEELTTANIYFDHFTRLPAEAISLYWEIPSKQEAGSQLVPHDMGVEVRHSIGKLTTFFTFLRNSHGNITAHKSFHVEEDEDTVDDPDYHTHSDFITQQNIDSEFKKIEQRLHIDTDIKGIKIDEMMAVRALLSSLYKI